MAGNACLVALVLVFVAGFERINASLEGGVALERVCGETARRIIVFVSTAAGGDRLSRPRLALIDSVGAEKAISAQGTAQVARIGAAAEACERGHAIARSKRRNVPTFAAFANW